MLGNVLGNIVLLFCMVCTFKFVVLIILSYWLLHLFIMSHNTIETIFIVGQICFEGFLLIFFVGNV